MASLTGLSNDCNKTVTVKQLGFEVKNGFMARFFRLLAKLFGMDVCYFVRI